MSLTTYAELQAAIIARSQKNNVSELVPDYITIAEAILNRALDTPYQLSRVTTNATAGNAYVSLPDDFLVMKNVQINNSGTYLLKYMTPDAMDKWYFSTSTSVPEAYTILGDELQLGPIPTSTYQIELAYTAKIPALSDTNTSNWLLALAPDLYLYTALSELFNETYDDARADKYKAWSIAIVKDLNALAKKADQGTSMTMVRG